MAEYSKKTVADLQEILKSRGLASSGKKADLIARLTEADKAAESKDTEPEAEVEPATEDAEPTEAAIPTTEDAKAVTTTEQQTDGQTTEQSADASSAQPAIEEKNFTLNLAASDVDREMERRKARAERFKTGDQAKADTETTEPTTADTEVLKNLERAKRFGTSTTAIGMLDSALPSERERGPRGKKRSAATEEASATPDDPGLKQNFNRKGRHGRDQRRKGPPGAKPTGITKSGSGYANDKDKQAAEARKKRFAASS